MAAPAPFDLALAHAPEGAHAVWLQTADGLRLRAAQLGHGSDGTVLLFAGRTEYLEKYGEAGARLAKAGLTTLSIDWRGQGLSDRLLDNPLTGHVDRFSDYQMDIAALTDWATEIGAPKPWYLLAHSMGGAIGLRALHDGLPVTRAVFSGPMWGIRFTPPLGRVARALAASALRFGLGDKMAPSAGATPHVLAVDPNDTLLTHDPSMMLRMRSQLEAEPKLGLAAPSLNWLHEALNEADYLQAIADPGKPVLTVLGSEERIVDTNAVRRMAGGWPNSRLEPIQGCSHEVMMELPDIREHAYQMMVDFFRE